MKRYCSRYFRYSVVLLIPLLLIAGCATRSDLKQINGQVAAINKKMSLFTSDVSSGDKNVSLQEAFQKLDVIIETLKLLDQIKVIKTNQANVRAEIDELVSYIQQVSGTLEELQRILLLPDKKADQIAEGAKKVETVRKSLDKINKSIKNVSNKVSRFQEIMEINFEEEADKTTYKRKETNSRVEVVEKKIEDLLDLFLKKSGKKRSKKKAGKEQKKKKEQQRVASADYKLAYNLYLNREYDAAIEKFQSYLSAHPKTRLSDNAQYWLAECYYSKRDFEGSLREFNKVIVHFSQSDKVSSALLKSAYALDRMDKTSEAISFLSILIEKYPQSEEADLGKKKLFSLQEKEEKK